MFCFELDKTTFLFGNKVKTKKIIKPVEFDDLEGPIDIDNFSNYALKTAIEILNENFGYSFPNLYDYDVAWLNIDGGKMIVFGTIGRVISKEFTLICREY